MLIMKHVWKLYLTSYRQLDYVWIQRNSMRKNWLTLGHTITNAKWWPHCSYSRCPSAHGYHFSYIPPWPDILALQDHTELCNFYGASVSSAMWHYIHLDWWVGQNGFQQVKLLITDSPALALFDSSLPTSVYRCLSLWYRWGAHTDTSRQLWKKSGICLLLSECCWEEILSSRKRRVGLRLGYRALKDLTKFTLQTDHQALTTVLNNKGMATACMRIAH